MTAKETACKTPLSYKNQTMAYFQGQIGQQKRLLHAVQKLLPTELAAHVHCCLIRDNKLLVYTDSPAWASQLRFYHATLLANISPTVADVQVKVTQQVGFVAGAERKAQLPCPEKIECIKNDSLNIDDEPLQAALLKLSATLERLSAK
ncbi:MAG: DUF721 domain-containing protein [Methylococcales bacterium]|jgi:hypothetical protein|nr:DUF721 domain-containing protein [Methylococcales bacterium]